MQVRELWSVFYRFGYSSGRFFTSNWIVECIRSRTIRAIKTICWIIKFNLIIGLSNCDICLACIRCKRLKEMKCCSKRSRVAPAEATVCCPPERRFGAICRRLFGNCKCKRNADAEHARNIRAKHSLTSVAPPPLSEVTHEWKIKQQGVTGRFKFKIQNFNKRYWTPKYEIYNFNKRY